MGIETIVELVVAGLLSAAIVWAMILDRRLRDLRSGKDGVRQAVIDLANATARAEAAIGALREAADSAGVRLANAQAGARSKSEELSLLVGAAEGLADRLATQRASTRTVAAAGPHPTTMTLSGAR